MRKKFQEPHLISSESYKPLTAKGDFGLFPISYEPYFQTISTVY